MCLRLHPGKFIADWACGAFALYYFWQHQLIWAVPLSVTIPLLSRLLVKRIADLEKFRQSSLGKYSAMYLDGTVRVLMSGGYFVMMLGAWERTTWIIAIGFFIALFALNRGMMFPEMT